MPPVVFDPARYRPAAALNDPVGARPIVGPNDPMGFWPNAAPTGYLVAPSTAPPSAHVAPPTASPAVPSVDDLIDYQRFAAARLEREPFDYLVVPEFIPPPVALAAAETFPGPALAGVLPAPAVPPNSAFGRLLAALRGEQLTDAFAAKFGRALSTDRLMVTSRARTRAIDGRIHNDSATKVITALIYLNGAWSDAGGRLRLLRGPRDLDDMIAEVPPLAGTLIAFARSDNSWHGHKPYEGLRQAIMLNWMTDAATARREWRRHALSAGVKRLFGAG